MVVGGLRQSPAGFRGTFVVVCYSSLGFLVHLVPVVGDLVATLWVIALQTIGLATLHRSGYARALVAISLPFLVAVAAILISGLLIPAPSP